MLCHSGGSAISSGCHFLRILQCDTRSDSNPFYWGVSRWRRQLCHVVAAARCLFVFEYDHRKTLMSKLTVLLCGERGGSRCLSCSNNGITRRQPWYGGCRYSDRSQGPTLPHTASPPSQVDRCGVSSKGFCAFLFYFKIDS